MELSNDAKVKIKEFEGCRLNAYKCPAGVLTIGYGHTGDDVYAGQSITPQKADMLFDADMRRFCRGVDMALGTTNLRQCQYDAVVSLAYNIGIAALRGSTLLRKVKSNPDNPAIRDEFMRWRYGNGKELPGLVKRRQWEAARYFGES